MAPVFKQGDGIAIGSKPAASGGVTIVDGAGYDACLAAARASGADGDRFRDSATGNLFIYRAVGSGILIPAQSGDFYTAPLALNASGDCYISDADTLANLLARGWVETYTSGSGFISKTAGQPLNVKGPTTAWANSRIAFSPSVAFDASSKFLLVTKIASVLSPDTLYATTWIRNADRILRIGIGVGTVEGDYSFLSGSGVIGAGNTAVGTASTWIAASFPASDPASLTMLADQGQTERALYADFAAPTTDSELALVAYNKGSARAEYDVSELFLFVV